MIKKKVTFFCSFFWLYHGKPVACPVLKKLLASNGFVYTTLKK